MLKTHMAGKGPEGACGLGLRLHRTDGAPACLCSQRVGDLAWEPNRLPGLEWAGQTSSAPLVLEGPSCLPLPVLPASLLRPQDQHGLEGPSEAGRPGLRAMQASGADWAGEMLAWCSPLV